MPPKHQSRLKQEAIDLEGELITPDRSMSQVNTLFVSNDGLPADEGYATQGERKVRSDAPSAVSPFPASDMDGAMTDLAATPGASLRYVGEKVSLLVNAIEKLRKLGIKEIATDLPELVLIGDQSSGKSSLMGAIAEINLPKSDGMCTKCPANIKTSPAATWSCTVSLHEEYVFLAGGNRRIPQPTARQKFPPWQENPEGLVVKTFKTLSDKAELEEVLRWAQIALLNPSQDFRSFVPGTGAHAQDGVYGRIGHKHEAHYSPNIVAIEISGPDLPALSFFDLPGIFASPESPETAYMVPVFKNLTMKYIEHENALVICAMTMRNDPGNSQAYSMLGKAKKRCMGVLTTPDLLQKVGDWSTVLYGTAYQLPRGYFVTKQPGPDFQSLGMDYHARARQEEDAFFERTENFAPGGIWGEMQSRFGTRNIQEHLSQAFANRIAQSIPTVKKRIEEQTRTVDDALAALPSLPNENVQHIVRARLHDFSTGVVRILEGGSYSNEFLSRWSALASEFQEAVLTMKPLFKAEHPSDRKVPENEVIDLDGDDDATPVPSRKHKLPGDPPQTPQAQRQKTSHGPEPTSSVKRDPESRSADSRPVSPVMRRRPPMMKFRTENFDIDTQERMKPMTLLDLHAVIAQHKRAGAPDDVSHYARRFMCLKAVGPWQHPLKRFTNRTFQMLREAVLAELLNVLGSYKQTELYRASKRYIEEFLDMHESIQNIILKDFYKTESTELLTFNLVVFKIFETDELKVLKGARRQCRVRAYVETQAALLRNTLSDATKQAKEKAVTDDQLGPDSFAKEIELAAYIRAYYRTAGLRFCDNLCQSIQVKLFNNIKEEIKNLLEGQLGLNSGDGEATCRSLMVEDDRESRQRRKLQKDKQALTEATAELARLVEDLCSVDGSQDNYEDAGSDDENAI